METECYLALGLHFKTFTLKHLKTKTFWLSACHSASGNATSVLGKRSEMFRVINSLTV